MHRTLDGAIAGLDAGEATAELSAQFESLRAVGLVPSYVDCHMGPSTREGFENVCRSFDLPFLYPMIEPCLHFESIAMLSPMRGEDKKPWLIERLENFEPGLHLIVTHPAVDDSELRSIARPDAENFCWAEPNRSTDLEVLLDPDVAERIETLGIELVCVADL